MKEPPCKVCGHLKLWHTVSLICPIKIDGKWAGYAKTKYEPDSLWRKEDDQKIETLSTTG